MDFKFTGKGNSLADKHKAACNLSSPGAGWVGAFGKLAGGFPYLEFMWRHSVRDLFSRFTRALCLSTK
jgi:hypothetical protein